MIIRNAAIHGDRAATIARFVMGLVAAGGTIVALAASAFGQSAAPRTTPGHPTDTPPEKIEPKPVPTSPVPEAPSGTLSNTLSKQKGVLKPPPGVDPEMHKIPAEGGRIRVIPPPAPGSTDAQPK